MHFWRIAGSTSAAKTSSGGAVNAYVAVSFIRGSRQVQVLALPGRAQDALGTPPTRECPRADRPHRLPFVRQPRSLPPKALIREATIPRRSRDTLSPRRLSPRWQCLFVPCPIPPRRLRLQTRLPSART